MDSGKQPGAFRVKCGRNGGVGERERGERLREKKIVNRHNKRCKAGVKKYWQKNAAT